MGTKSVKDDLSKDEYGFIILDCRVLVDGYNEPILLMNFVKTAMTLYSIAVQKNIKLILQCQAGLSRSNAIALAILTTECGFEFEDALEYVKKKVPIAQMNNDLLNCLRRITGFPVVGEFKIPEKVDEKDGNKE